MMPQSPELIEHDPSNGGRAGDPCAGFRLERTRMYACCTRDIWAERSSGP